jgi:hypothetical protein
VGPGADYFNGSGTLAQLTLKIIQGVGPAPSPSDVSCPIAFAGLDIDSYLLSGLVTISPVTWTDGSYHLTFVKPGLPRLYLSPASIKPASISTVFGVSVYIDGLSATWQIIGFQFSIQWNTTLIAPAIGPNGNYFDNGTFLETFMYNGPGGVVYATDLNTHTRLSPMTPIFDDYNYSIVGELLLPDFAPPYDGTYHAPYPSTSAGPGLLGTFWFKPVLDTTASGDIKSTVDFIAEDVFVLDQFATDLGYTTLTGATYTVPHKVLGRNIDLYTQYPYPYGGQGANQTSDSFGPQQEVKLCANVTYNAYPVAGKLVAFHITHVSTDGQTTFDFYREGATDTSGAGCVTFNIPWPFPDPVDQIFGWWYVTASVDIANGTAVDNLRFWVWWPVQVIGIEPKFTAVNHATPETGLMNFMMTYLTYHMQDIPVLLSGTIYDELGFFIGGSALGPSNIYSVTPQQPLGYPSDLSDGNYSLVTTYNGATVEEYANGTDFYPAIFTWDFSVPLVSNAVVGKGTAFGDAFSDLLQNGGVAYCPEVMNTKDFYIATP